MNTFVSGALLSLGVSLGAQQATAGDFAQAISPGAFFDAVTQNNTPPKDPKKEIADVQLKTSNEVFQLVGNTLIPTDYQQIQKYKTYDCRELTTEHGQSGFYFHIKKKDILEIKNSPKCKK